MRILLKQNNLKSRFIANVAGMQPLNEGPKIPEYCDFGTFSILRNPKT